VTISLIGFAIVLLIAYWWLGAGALGGFLHFACVVIAGAIAFAAWEPVAYLLIAGPMGGYAKGVSLLGIFIVSLLVLRKLPQMKQPLPPSPAEKVVDAACTWYTTRLADRPSVQDVAREVHVSPSTLRRMFQETRRQTPLKIFSRLRLEAAMQLLAESNLKLEDVASACGYSCASDFCRSFHAEMKRTPAAWRRDLPTGPGYVRR